MHEQDFDREDLSKKFLFIYSIEDIIRSKKLQFISKSR